MRLRLDADIRYALSFGPRKLEPVTGRTPAASRMNIFFLSYDPRIAARYHCDKHVVKMLLESTQLLWTAHHVAAATTPSQLIPDIESAPTTLSSGGRQHGYKPTHKNHPCAIWVRTSITNYRWLVLLAEALAAEYHYRWPARTTPHACEAHVAWLKTHEPPLPLSQLTEPPQAMPPEFKTAYPIYAYRAYYLGDKAARGLLTYTRRDPPVWVTANLGY